MDALRVRDRSVAHASAAPQLGVPRKGLRQPLMHSGPPALAIILANPGIRIALRVIPYDGLRRRPGYFGRVTIASRGGGIMKAVILIALSCLASAPVFA